MPGREFAFSPVDATAALAQYRALPVRDDAHGDLETNPLSLRQAQLAALISAELLAAQAGVVPFATSSRGPGVSDIGAARDKIEGASVPEPVRVLYLATYRRVRQSIAVTRPAPARGERLVKADAPGDVPTRLGPAMIVVLLGAAAMIATAFYAGLTKSVAIYTDAKTTVDMARIEEMSRLALAELKATGKISNTAWQAFRTDAKDEIGSAFGSVIRWGAALGALFVGVRYVWPKLARKAA